jgi:HEAT repeat protein
MGLLKFQTDTKKSVGMFEDKRGDQQIVDNLLKALKDKEINVRAAAAAALANYGKPEIAKQLLVLLKDQIPNMRAAAAIGLGGCPYPEVVPALILRLKDEDFWTRLCAARSLGKLKDPVALEFLMDALHDHNSSVRQNGVRALLELGEQGIGETSFWQRAIDQFVILGSSDSSEEVQAAAQEAVLRLQSRSMR